MITYAQIIDAAGIKIKSKFPNIVQQVIDNQEGMKRPSFRVRLDNVNTSNFMCVARDRGMTIRIYYFPSDPKKYGIEMLDIQEGLEEIFINDNVITLDDGSIIEIFESETDIIDGVLHFYIDIQLSEKLIKADDGEFMEEVEL